VAEDEPGEERTEADSRPARPIIAAAITILIAAIAGLSIGKAAQPEKLDPAEARQQSLTNTREATITEVSREAAIKGYREGRKLGARQGKKSGKGAGQADGQIQAQLEAVSEAEAAAAAAQSALAEISAPPPTPPASQP
jgi:flagellar biosynthesis/type III secretory pathway protein FliH